MKKRVLFLCTANSARSIMAEAILRQLGKDDVEVMSAGTEPTQPHPEAIAALQSLGIEPSGLQSTAVSELEEQTFDYVISLCDRARSECQTAFAEQNFIAWDFPDPVASHDAAAFKKTAHELSERIRMFLLILRRQQQRPHLFDQPQDFFKVMSDPLRLQMILLVAQQQELCVCDLVEATGMSQPKVSRHLAQLREFGLLADRKDARWVYYRLSPALPDWMRRVIQTTADYTSPHQR
ncbi:metalloregulator ArsR/SmtB family transcription factor [Pseudidiomarina homiensis]|uniref:ArsR family transcriptional regulator n=1 Tax=Pseudidiomarina homiensis TaxID=364198 RepID=A0A432XXV8_9GAMM|nr:metalloregulator ArsR/SmtB family transcription factor [Pseudidiomarina homiensis]RUO53527.1 ArsR family transcriptional regulator [Pseudidiomarina homiensis]